MPTRTGWAILGGGAAFLVVGWALGYREIGLVGLALVLAVLSGFLWLGRRDRLTVERSLEPPRVTRGDVALGSLQVRNPGRRPVARVIARERVGDDAIDVPVPRVPAGGSRAVRYQLPTDRRCILDVGPLLLSRSDPFTLVRFEQGHGQTRQLYVHPRRYPLTRLPATLLRSLEGPTTSTAPGGTQVFHALREYVAGDDRRHIHWRSSARVGTLMVRHYVDTSLPDITVLLDIAPDRHDDASFEENVEVAASFVASAAEQGFPVRLVTSDGRAVDHLGIQRGAVQLLDYLAGLVPVRGAHLARTLERLRRGGNTLIVVSRDLDGPDCSAIAARRATFRGVVVASAGPHVGDQAAPPHGVPVFRAETGGDVIRRWNAGR